ncbi:MAG: cytochrome c oxidase subunit 3, partial [Rhizobiaceae bacterium]
FLSGAGLLGLVFVAVKLSEYAAKAALGYGMETDAFFTLYYLVTGFHLAHVMFGIGVLGLIALFPARDNVETGIAFWHMVDLVWVMIFPIFYLLR